ncbi:hypothetical protein KP509_02G093600 [Ceratopteris richardii]|uniref:Uncharacterized protein n=1 Tax=Ceratopteris richardii TaxID=49495 RepID=A0A8T2VGV6_CERRI|nr:hypothetical protein KP509_02G093600 [Ceratopteris richardii]
MSTTTFGSVMPLLREPPLSLCLTYCMAILLCARDWYNIEKSRRVKAFRCGDFDECIERAKSLASVLTKKREKYARREDAILHALELEKRHSEKNCRLLEGSFSTDQTYKHFQSFVDDDLVMDDDIDGMANHSGFHSDFMDPESSADATQASLDSIFSFQGDKKFFDGDWDDDIHNTFPRMRGSQDFGLKMPLSKDRKPRCFTEDEQKMTNCITKTMATCSMPISCKNSRDVGAVSKRKRPSQAGYIDDEGALKKNRRKPMNFALENSMDIGNSVTNLGSKPSVLCPIADAEKDGSALLQPKQESNAVIFGNAYEVSSEMKSLTSIYGQELWPAPQIDCGGRYELLSTSSGMDKECSGFSDHIRSAGCTYVDSQMDSTPLTAQSFSDPFVQGAPGSRSLVFPSSVYTGSYGVENDNGFSRAGSLPTADNVCSPLPGFPLWPYYGHREVMFEKFGHDLGFKGQISSSRAVGYPDYSFDSTIPNASSPTYNLYNNPVEDNSTYAKGNEDEREGCLLSSNDASKAEILKASYDSPKQHTSVVTEGEETTNEDEVDSFQPMRGIADPFSFNKAIGAQDAYCPLKVERASGGFCNMTGCNEAKNTIVKSGFINTEDIWNDRLDEDTGFLERNNVSYDHHSIPPCSDLNRWKVKGKRGVRVSCGNSWALQAADGTLTRITQTTAAANELNDSQEAAEAEKNDIEPKKRMTRGFKYSSKFDSSSEEEPSTERCPMYQDQVIYQNKFNQQNFHSSNLLEVHEPSWFEVSLEVDHVKFDLYQDQTPQVCMMSMLKGKPIVGYAVNVEIVEKRYRDIQYGRSWRNFSSSIVRRPMHPVWRTRRRTAMQRVPRSFRSVIPRDLEPDRQQHPKFHNSLASKVAKKGSSLMSSCLDKRRSQKKLGLVPQKTRMLSSIAVPSNEEGTDHDAIKNASPPLVTCIPVSMIFTRIREVLYKAVDHGASDSDNIS